MRSKIPILLNMNERLESMAGMHPDEPEGGFPLQNLVKDVIEAHTLLQKVYGEYMRSKVSEETMRKVEAFL